MENMADSDKILQSFLILVSNNILNLIGREDINLISEFLME